MEKNATMGFLLRDIISKSKWVQINDAMCEAQLYDGLSIETWKTIADAVQKFEISDGSSNELYFNLAQLDKALEKIDVNYLQTGKRKADFFLNIGLVTIIEQIYAISASNKKEHFAKQIEELEKIGVDTIALSTNKGSSRTILGIETSYIYPNKNHLLIDKIYTDGTFCIENSGGYSHQYNITELKGENYCLSCELTSEEGEAKLWKAKAYLNNFQGKYPTKEEVLELRQPKIVPVGMENDFLSKFLESKNLYQDFEEYIINFLTDKSLYQEYIDLLANTFPQESMEWQVTRKRVRQILK